MSTSEGGGNIVTNGLVFCLDFANTKCFTSGDSFCYDLSKNGIISELKNSPTYNTSNFGSLVFDGTNQFIDTPPYDSIFGSYGILATNNFTIDLWCLPTLTHGIDPESTTGTGGVTGQRYIVDPVNNGSNAGVGISLGTNGVSVYEHGNAYMPSTLVYSGVTINTFTNIVVTYTNKQPRLYLNNVLVRTGLTSPKTSSSLILREVGRGDYGYYGGRLSITRYYNRTLSTSEITQNYNCSKNRFGL